MNTRVLPGILAPRYQELHANLIGESSAISATCVVHSFSDDSVASISDKLLSFMKVMQSVIHSTCCSMDVIMLERTEGLPGPVIVNKFGKLFIDSPKNVTGPFFHLFFKVEPDFPSMLIDNMAPVIASKPVAKIIVSNWCDLSAVCNPSLVILMMGFEFTSINETLFLLKVSK